MVLGLGFWPLDMALLEGGYRLVGGRGRCGGRRLLAFVTGVVR